MTEQTAFSDLASRVYATSHLTGSFRLRSGQTSVEYFVRKQAKDYGTCKLADVAGRRVVVVEDVVTTGGAVLTSCADLREAPASTRSCAIDREQAGAGNLAAAGLDLRSVLTRSELERAAGR